MKITSTLNRLFGSARTKVLVSTGIALGFAGAASGATIGMHFVRGAGADVAGVQNGIANSLLATDTAGAAAYVQANWNNLGSRGTNIALTDSASASSPVLINWVSGNCWSISGGGTPTVQGTPDTSLMNGYLDSNGTGNSALGTNLFIQPNNNSMPLVYFSGLSAWMVGQGVPQYDLVVYIDGDAQNGRCGEYWLQTASGPYDNMVLGSDMTTHTFTRDFNNFTANPVYQQVVQTSDNGRVAGAGNYLVFTGLSADTFLIRTAEFNTRATINAIQIIPRATAVGATMEPLPESQTYAGRKAAFRAKVAGVLPMTFQWRKGAANLTDGGNVSGSTTATLNITGVSGPDAGNYSVVVSNAGGLVTSTVAPLTVTSPDAGSYAEKVLLSAPVAYWRFNEIGDPSTNNSPAYDAIGGFNAIYGTLAQNGYNGIIGPQPAGFPGFEANNSAMQTASANPASVPYPSSYVTWAVAPPLNLNTNTVTMCAWINPAAVVQAGSSSLIFSRGTGSDISGFGYGANNNLGYTWNNQGNTFGFGYGSVGYPENGLQPPSNQWSFVACVITPSNAILYLLNANGQFSATNTVTHTNGAWASGLTMIGDDPSSTGVPQNRAFTGVIDEAAVFNRSLTATEIQDLYKKGLQVIGIPPVISVQPLSLALLQGRNARFSVAASGDATLTYQWRTNGVNLTDGGSISGAAAATLSITSVALANAAAYDVVVANGAGSITSRVATLTVVSSNAVAPYEAKLRLANPIAYWRANEASGSPSLSDFWGGNILSNASVTLGISGPVPPQYTGMEATNTAGQYDGFGPYSESGVRLMNNLPQFSVIGWFNTAGPIGNRIGLFGQNDVIEFGFHGNGTDGMAQVGIFTPRGSAFLNQSTNVTPGVWYLIAAVGSGTNVSLYLASTNGAGGVKVMQATTTHAAAANYGASLFPFRVGGGGILDTAGNFFPGIIDEVAVFNRAITVDELSGFFGAALSGGDLPPTISADPVSQTLYAGRTATFTVTALGSSPKYQWRTNGVPVPNNGNLSGATTATLTITSVSVINQASYDVVITNGTGSITSAPATLTIITPIPNSYEAAVIALNPVAYYRLNETNDPSGGTAPANDYWGGHNGTYGAAAQNGFNAIAGPRAADGFNVFDSANTALQSFNGTADSYVTVTPPGITTNTITITAWINPTSYADARMSIVFARAGQPATGLNFNGQSLNYHWLDDANSYNWNPGLIPPTNQWSFVALVVEPTQATIYLINTNGATNAVNVLAHANRAFTDNIRIGGDPNNNTTRTFSGVIDEVAIFGYSLSPSQIQNLYLGAPTVTLSVQRVGGNIVLSWPQGTLLEANEATGPYTTNNVSSPYTNAPTAARKFYRVIVK